MRVVYSDESGLGSEREEPLTVVGALMLNMDSQWSPVLEAIEDALIEAFGAEKADQYEIKGRILYHKIARGDEKSIQCCCEL